MVMETKWFLVWPKANKVLDSSDQQVERILLGPKNYMGPDTL